MDAAIHLAGRLEPRDAWRADRCAMARTLDVVRTKSAMLVLREAFYGTTRFDDFVARTEASEPVVAGRLRELVAAGLLEHVDYRNPGERTRKGYRLTDKGADLFPVLAALMQWGDRWLGDQSSGVRLEHHGCGEPVAVTLRCAAGHGVTIGEVDLAIDRSSPRSPYAAR
jgi:DNA-binding HxlR family transcriptional regulator